MTRMRSMPMSTEGGGGEASERSGGEASERGGKKASRRREIEVSSGGVVIDGDSVIVIVPKRKAADGRSVLGLPKGHIDRGETSLHAALREVHEEAGVISEHVADLGEVRYWYSRSGRPRPKVVHFYLLRYLSGSVDDHDDEVEEAMWMPLSQALEELTYEGEREVVSRAMKLMRSGGSDEGLRAGGAASHAASVATGREDR